MKPSLTCHITRSILKEIGAGTELDHNGLYVQPPQFPDVNLDSDSFRAAWLGYNIARKRELDNPETESAARAAFFATEDKCATIEKETILWGLGFEDTRFIFRAAQIMRDLLGERPPKDWFRYCEFTGGASTSRKRSESHPALKWWASSPLHVTPLALRHLLDFKEQCAVVDVAWSDPGILSCGTYSDTRPFYKVVPGSHLAFVEKNYKTKRAILLEPDGNMLLQKGVGKVIRRCLRAVGINLNSQSRNQQLAFAGSISGSLGTIDISAASDSVTLALLRVLLPWEWYQLIYELRSPCFKDGDEWFTMRKVSSMGNGFTFELESAVFYCIAQAVIDLTYPADTRIAIFGDDIIIASGSCAQLIRTLNQCGFEVNTEKSFWEGPFRESCGKHYHSGADVTPVYIKGDLDLGQLYRLYNQVRDWAGGVHYDPRYSQMLDRILAAIPHADRCQIPVEYSSICGLYYPDACTKKISRHVTSKGDFVRFSVLADKVSNDPRFVEDELRWLYSHMTNWVPSCPLGTSEYTSLTFKTEGASERRTVSIPYAAVSQLIA